MVSSDIRLPLELTDLIIDFLHDSKPTLKTTALVCRDWLPESRYHLFREIHLNQYPSHSIEPFLELCKSPLVTFSPVAKDFVLALLDFKDDGFDKLLRWRDTTGTASPENKTRRTLGTVLPRVTTLTLIHVGLPTLGNLSHYNLFSSRGYWKNTLTRLRLYFVEFRTADEFYALVSSFHLLQLLEINRPSVAFDTFGFKQTGNRRPLPPNLRETVLEHVHYASLIHALGSCTTVSNLSCIFHAYQNATQDRMMAIGKILRSAGLALKKLTFVFSSGFGFREYDLDSAFKHLDLSRNKNLESLNFNIQHGQYLIPFLARTAAQFNPIVDQPSLESIDINFLEEYKLNWDELDLVIQSPVFSSLHELTCTVRAYYEHPFILQNGDDPPESSEVWQRMRDQLAKLNQQLPRCVKRGVLRPRKHYYDLWDW